MSFLVDSSDCQPFAVSPAEPGISHYLLNYFSQHLNLKDLKATLALSGEFVIHRSFKL